MQLAAGDRRLDGDAQGTVGIQQVAKNSAHCGLAFFSNLSLLNFYHLCSYWSQMSVKAWSK